MSHPQVANSLVPDDEEVLAHDLVDLPLLDLGEEVRSVRDNELFHPEICQREENNGRNKAAEHQSVVEAGQRCNGSVVEGGPQAAEGIDLDKEKVTELVE